MIAADVGPEQFHTSQVEALASAACGRPEIPTQCFRTGETSEGPAQEPERFELTSATLDPAGAHKVLQRETSRTWIPVPDYIATLTERDVEASTLRSIVAYKRGYKYPKHAYNFSYPTYDPALLTTVHGPGPAKDVAQVVTPGSLALQTRIHRRRGSLEW